MAQQLVASSDEQRLSNQVQAESWSQHPARSAAERLGCKLRRWTAALEVYRCARGGVDASEMGKFICRSRVPHVSLAPMVRRCAKLCRAPPSGGWF
jgi:hypothetical protein